MGKITGIGGVFLNLDTDTVKLLKWYKEVLEIDVSEYGLNFLDQNNMGLVTFKRGENKAILNFSVDHLDDYVMQLKAKDVVFHQPLKEYDYGKFCQIVDIGGNVIELCELNEQVYRKMVEEEIK